MSDRSSTLNVPSKPECVSQIEPFIDEVANRFNLPSDIHGPMLVSLTEAVVNAMLHGNKYDSNKNVSICLKRKKDCVSVSVSDEGPGFDVKDVPDPTCPTRLEECGGRGIFLMQNLADDCHFKENGTTVEMRFDL